MVNYRICEWCQKTGKIAPEKVPPTKCLAMLSDPFVPDAELLVIGADSGWGRPLANGFFDVVGDD
jgi:hypothetical protein